MKTLALTREQANELYVALSTRICVIETGDPTLRAVDVAEMIRVESDGLRVKQLARMIRPLTKDQRTLISELEDLQQKLL